MLSVKDGVALVEQALQAKKVLTLPGIEIAKTRK